MTRTEENINWLAERAERSVMGLSGHAWGIRSEIAQRVKELRAELVATQVSPPTCHDCGKELHPMSVQARCSACVSNQVSPSTAVTPRWAEDAETPQPVRKIELHRCTICGTRWLLWPDAIHGGGWNLLDKWQRPGSCCDNVAMGDQIEHLRDFELVSPPTPMARLQGALRGEETDEQFDTAVNAIRVSPPTPEAKHKGYSMSSPCADCLGFEENPDTVCSECGHKRHEHYAVSHDLESACGILDCKCLYFMHDEPISSSVSDTGGHL